MELSWCCPVSGDGDVLGETWDRPPSLDYAVRVFEAAGAAGFRYVLIGMGFDHHVMEAWTLGSAVLARTRACGAMIAVRPGFFSAPVLAKMAATLDHLSEGRLALNVVSGGRVAEQAMFGDYLDHDARYRRTAETMALCRRLWTETEAFDFQGEFHSLKRTRLEQLPFQPGGPRYYFGGASGVAEMVGAEHADVHLLWGETLAQAKERVGRIRWLAAQAGRSSELRVGVRINVIARATEDEARDVAAHLVHKLSPTLVAKKKARDLTATERDSVGQKRQWELLAKSDADLYVEPLLWAGISVARSGAGMAVVGSYEQVAGRLAEYARLGVSAFILSGYPHLEEATRVGNEVGGRLRRLLGAESGDRHAFVPK